MQTHHGSHTPATTCVGLASSGSYTCSCPKHPKAIPTYVPAAEMVPTASPNLLVLPHLFLPTESTVPALARRSPGTLTSCPMRVLPPVAVQQGTEKCHKLSFQ